jgi:WXG100 family type VII secretion target
MADGTRIDDTTLHSAANDCRTAMDNVNAEASKVRGAKESVAARWRGGASNTFQSVMDKWLVDANKLLEALQGISELLDKTASTHRSNEDQQDSMFNKFNAAING